MRICIRTWCCPVGTHSRPSSGQQPPQRCTVTQLGTSCLATVPTSSIVRGTTTSRGWQVARAYTSIHDTTFFWWPGASGWETGACGEKRTGPEVHSRVGWPCSYPRGLCPGMWRLHFLCYLSRLLCSQGLSTSFTCPLLGPALAQDPPSALCWRCHISRPWGWACWGAVGQVKRQPSGHKPGPAGTKAAPHPPTPHQLPPHPLPKGGGGAGEWPRGGLAGWL